MIFSDRDLSGAIARGRGAGREEDMNQNVTERSGNAMDPSSIAAQLGIVIARRASPRAIDWIRSRLGITLLLLGPPGSGKTAFFRYLNYGLLFPESEHTTTVETTSAKPMSMAIGNERLKLSVRRALDTPGQLEAVTIAELIKTVRPHALLLILDATAPIVELQKWILDFCEHAEHVFRESPIHKRKIRSFIVCLNKVDKGRAARYLEARRRAVRDSLVDGLKTALGVRYVKSIAIMPCVSVQSSLHGSRLIDAVIAELAIQVR